MFKSNKCLQHTFLASILLIIGLFNTASATVVTSIRPLGFIASAIAEGVIPVEVLLPDGASPHNYALRPSDIQRLQRADLILWVGPEMETFLSKPLKQMMANKQITIAQLPAVVGLLRPGHAHDEHAQESATHHNEDHTACHHHGDHDMHIWLSPEIVKIAAMNIHNKLLEIMPHKKEKLDANLYQFEDKLAQSEKKIASMLQPIQDKGYFVFHDAYGYFEKQFGLRPLGHFTVNPEIQPGAQRLHKIRTQLVEQKAVCVFAEPQFRSAIINAVTKGTNVRIGMLDPLGNGVVLGKDSYVNFLFQLSGQYVSCLE